MCPTRVVALDCKSLTLSAVMAEVQEVKVPEKGEGTTHSCQLLICEASGFCVRILLAFLLSCVSFWSLVLEG